MPKARATELGRDPHMRRGAQTTEILRGPQQEARKMTRGRWRRACRSTKEMQLVGQHILPLTPHLGTCWSSSRTRRYRVNSSFPVTEHGDILLGDIECCLALCGGKCLDGHGLR